MNYPTKPVKFQIAYVNWIGQWTNEPKKYATRRAAETAAKKIAKSKAENGRVTVFETY